MKISIIMPVYNGERFLRHSITNLLAQSYENIELILVNDGSTDNSLSICDEFKMLDKRVVVVNKENGGICSARNVGLEKATGEIISFIDQDDEIRENIYVDLMAGFLEDVDLVVSGKEMQLINEKNQVISCVKYEYADKYISDDEDKKDLALNIKNDSCVLHLWNCIYRNDVIRRNNIKFNESLKYGHEDTLFNIEYVYYSRKIHTINGIVYNYYRRKHVSTSLKKNNLYINDFEMYINKVYELYGSNIHGDENKLYTYAIRLGISLYLQYAMINKYDDLKRIWEILFNLDVIHRVNRSAVYNRKYYLFLCAVDFCVRNGLYGLGSFLINLKKSKK